ncbi:hypothetical protein MNBD_GAMMA15-620 [hydrothermal vent metagenome]|uniref:Glycosyl transferase family 28 C-terminal domain-containing protein n=1 Tax=hydrothermal vent metagenome TaxID=652676 RepID=A0A3B0YPG2_9ZZZZ
MASTLPEHFLRERIDADFHFIQHASDFGLVMHSALDIDLETSATRYAQLHKNWDTQVDAEAQFIVDQQADLVLADVPYLTLAGAAQSGIPAFALCSLNWADIYRHYFHQRPEAIRVLVQMEAAYASAQIFFCPEPSMSMAFLDNTLAVGPIARQGKDCRLQLNHTLDLAENAALILIAPGGIDTRFPVENWPHGQGIHWLVSERWQVDHPDISTLSETGLSFTDLLVSCDGVLGKCGYGTVTECVVNGTPLLYIPRPDWPEEKSLLDWLTAYHAAVRIEPAWLEMGALRESVDQALGLKVKPCIANGAEQIADTLQGFINGK